MSKLKSYINSYLFIGLLKEQLVSIYYVKKALEESLIFVKINFWSEFWGIINIMFESILNPKLNFFNLGHFQMKL